MAKVTLFDEILDELEPILTNNDLGFSDEEFELTVYHPSVLSQEISLKIFDGQTKVDYFNDLASSKANKLDALREVENPNEENLKERQNLATEIIKLNESVDEEIHAYVEFLSKLESGELQKKIDKLYEIFANKVKNSKDADEVKKYKKFLNYPQRKLISGIFKKINQALSEYRQKELNISEEESTTSEKK